MEILCWWQRLLRAWVITSAPELWTLGLLFDFVTCESDREHGWILWSFSSLGCGPPTAMSERKQCSNTPCLPTTGFPWQIMWTEHLWSTLWVQSALAGSVRRWCLETGAVGLWEFSPVIAKYEKWRQCGEFFINHTYSVWRTILPLYFCYYVLSCVFALLTRFLIVNDSSFFFSVDERDSWKGYSFPFPVFF